MKTTLEIPDSLFRKVKAQAAMEGLKMKDLVTSALDSYLHGHSSSRKLKTEICPFPLVRGKGGPLLKKLDNKTIAGLMEEDDLENYRRSVGH